MYNIFKNAVDFDYVLVDKYKKINLTENELAVVLVMHHIIEQGNTFVTPDALALKMQLNVNEIDKILVKLVSKNLLEYETVNDNLITSLRPLKERLIKEMQIDILEQKEIIEQTSTKESIKDIKNHFVECLGRNLTPLENERIHDWIKYGYTSDMIISSLNEALSNNKKTIMAVDKILQKKAARNDIAKEGYTATNSNYHKDITKTIDDAAKDWNK